MIRYALLCLALLQASAAYGAEIRIDALYPEGPLWVRNTLYYAEMGADRVNLVEGDTPRPFWRRSGCGPTAIAPFGEHDFLVLCHLEGAVVHVSPRGETLAVIRRESGGGALRNPNDATADGKGGVYFTDSGPFVKGLRPSGKIMHIDPRGAITQVAENLDYANGIVFDAANDHLYASEHLGRRILRFTVSQHAVLTGKEVFSNLNTIAHEHKLDYDKSGPDGLEIGPDGRLWVPEYGQGRLLILDLDGSLHAALAVEMPFVTSLAFDSNGKAAITGAFENVTPPLRGRVVITDGL